KECPIISAHDLEDSGPRHGGDGCAKISGGRNLRSAGFNAGSELVFPLAVAARSGAWKIHELLLKTKIFLSIEPIRMARKHSQMPRQSRISGCDPAFVWYMGFPESLKYLRAIFDSGTVT